MKINHTPLGVLSSNKKVIAGIAALALIGGITPALIKNTHAKVSMGPETIYTTVGPDYFTILDDSFWEYFNDDSYDIYVKDTSVADFYHGEDSNSGGSIPVPIRAGSVNGAGNVPSYYPIYGYECEDYYVCLQGKKVGDTEIVIEKEGEDAINIPVTSVKMSPDANNLVKSGIRHEVVGSIEGADNNLLVVRNVLADGGASGMKTGDRSFQLYSESNVSNSSVYDGYAAAVWTIGNQQVGGGTFYDFYTVEVADKMLNSESNIAKLEDTYADIMLSLRKNVQPGPITDRTITTDKGNVIQITRPNTSGMDIVAPKGYNITLDSTKVSLAEITKNQLKAELPADTKQVKYENINTTFNMCFYTYPYSGGNTTKGGNMTRDLMSVVGPDYSYYDVECACIGNLLATAEPLDMSLDVSNAKALKDGYTRKWYVTRNNNGNIERLDATYDEDTDTIRFASNIFGDYAYGYVDERDAPLVPNTGIAPKQIATTAVATIAPLAAITFLSFGIRSKKRAANKLAKKHNHFE